MPSRSRSPWRWRVASSLSERDGLGEGQRPSPSPSQLAGCTTGTEHLIGALKRSLQVHLLVREGARGDTVHHSPGFSREPVATIKRRIHNIQSGLNILADRTALLGGHPRAPRDVGVEHADVWAGDDPKAAVKCQKSEFACEAGGHGL